MSLYNKAYLKWLWLSKTYSFLFAHKPLCSHFKQDTISIRGIHLCRSCFFAYFGILAGLFLPVDVDMSAQHISVILSVLLFATLPFSHPAIYKKIPRLLRDLLRFNLGVIISFSLLLPIYYHQEFLLSAVTIGISLIFGKFYYKRRSIRKIQLCKNCSEYQTGSICSGYQMQATLIREYEEKATEFKYKTGYIPKILQGK